MKLRSDLLGNFLPLMGRDWSHAGVTALFSSVAKHGYEFLYLTSRAIGQVFIIHDVDQRLLLQISIQFNCIDDNDC